MKYINDGLIVLKGNAGPSLRRSVNNAAMNVLESNKRTLLGEQIIAWHKLDLKSRGEILRKEFHQRIPEAKEFQIDGILANFYSESRFTTAMQNTATQPYQQKSSGSGAIGLAQWMSPDRQRILLTAGAKYAALKEQPPLIFAYLHPIAQVDTMMYELTHTHKRALTSLLSTGSVESAVSSWLRFYEGILPSDIAKHGASYGPAYRVREFRKLGL